MPIRWRPFPLPTLASPTTVVLLVVSVIVSLFGVVGWKTWQAREARLARAARDTQNLSHSLAQHASRTIEAIDLPVNQIQRQVGLIQAAGENAARFSTWRASS